MTCKPTDQRPMLPALAALFEPIKNQPYDAAWCLKMAELEAGHEVGAGFESADDPERFRALTKAQPKDKIAS